MPVVSKFGSSDCSHLETSAISSEDFDASKLNHLGSERDQTQRNASMDLRVCFYFEILLNFRRYWCFEEAGW